MVLAVTPEELKRGLSVVSWPGRCEIVRESPRVILDCAHNESAASVLGDTLTRFSYNRLILILGIMSDKDIEAIFAKLVPIADHIILTSPKVERAESSESLLAQDKRVYQTHGLKRRVHSGR